MPRTQNTGLSNADVDAIAAQVVPIFLVAITVYISIKMMYRAVRSTVVVVFWVLKWTAVVLLALYIYSLWNSDTSLTSSLAPIICELQLTASGSSFLTLGAAAVQQAGGLVPLLEQLNIRPTQKRRRRNNRKSSRKSNHKSNAEEALEESIAEFSESIGLDKYVDEILGKKKKRNAFF